MNAHDVLFYGHRWVHMHLQGLTDEQLLKGNVCGWWSVKDITGHLASFEWMLVDVFQCFVEPVGPTPILDQHNRMNGDEFNAVQVEQRKNLTPAAVIADYDAGYEKVMKLLPELNLETLRKPGTIPWYGNEYSLEDLIVYQYYGHKREHMAQVAVYRDTLK